jgi:signal transduction histidine kinase
LIEVATGFGAGHATLTVTNTGPVVPPGELDRLFRPFQRLDPMSTGSGLGLAIVAWIAAAHDARLVAQARAGGGLEVGVAFPASRPARAAADATARARRPVAGMRR